MSKQWGHGFHQGKKEGEDFGFMLGEGAESDKFSKLADRLFILANALQLPAECGGQKSHVWWALYACVISRQMKDICREMPGLMTHFKEDSGGDQ